MTRRSTSRGPAAGDIAVDHDALLVLDVDEVVLEFIDPFQRLLLEGGARLHPESFRLTGNVRSMATGAALSGDALALMTEQLYREQAARQRPVEGVETALSRLSRRADIVFLTAMTPLHYPARRALLDRHGLLHPMIATERRKGGVVAELSERRSGPVVFVDDLPPNLASVARSAPGTHLVHLMANEAFREHLPSLPAGTHAATDWPHAVSIIEALIERKEP